MSKLNPKGTLVRKKFIQVVRKYEDIERQLQEIKDILTTHIDGN